MTALTRLIASSPFRLSLAYLAAFVLVAALVVGFIGWRANELLTTQVIETLSAEVTGLREQFQVGGASRLRDIVADRSQEPGGGLYLLSDATGRKLAGNLARAPFQLEDGRGGVFRYRRASDAASRKDRIAVGVPLAVPGGFTLVVGRDIEDQQQFADTLWKVALWGIGLLAIVGIVAGLLISRTVLGRIEAINAAARTIMAGDLTSRIPIAGSGDEFDRLSTSLNDMLARIEELMAALREVSSNIAHDLRTPLNRLRNNAEEALRHPADVAAYRAALAKTIEEADELIRTFNSLLLIARLEGRAVADSMAEIDVSAVAADVAELYEPVAEEAGLRLVAAAPPGIALTANRELISQAMANLVDNAIKYSAAPGAGEGAARTVTISVARAGPDVEIVVSDEGPGVAPEDRQRALQRFVRLDGSRSAPGSGLGLSLVAAVARLHGGSVRLEDNHPGLRVVLSLPAHQRTTGPRDAGALRIAVDPDRARALTAPV
ncbi:MAG: ATP-binding protein [Hyphomicrobiaceae bacterium]|nr:ATP-binding protein [Hyphomicrobiaceae bacterium]